MADEKFNEVFIDAVDKIHFLGAMVRIDFATFVPNAEDPNNPTLATKERLIMTPEGFIKTFNSMQQLAEQLIKQGVLRKNEPQNSTTSPRRTPKLDEEK